MGARTASSRSTRTASTRSGSIAVIGDPTTDTTNDYVLTGSGATGTAVFTELLSTANTATGITSVPAEGSPIISNVAYTNSSYTLLVGNTAANLLGAYASVFGTGFQSNSNVFINGTLVSNTFVSTTRINLPLPTVSVAGTYNLMVFNSNNLAALTTLSYNTGPVWTQSSFSGIFGTVSVQLAATGAVLYTITPGSSLPAGLSLNSATGSITGTLAAATYSFSVTATNQFGLTTAQTVTIAIGQAYTINFLLVGGGGSGGAGPTTPVPGIPGPPANGGAGGGAGGVVLGTYVSPTTDTMTIGTGGGASGAISGIPPPPGGGGGASGGGGGNSYITGTTLGNIVALGGGAGSFGGGSGQPGGSGGGGGGNAPGGQGTGIQPSQNPGNPYVTAQYGNPGGTFGFATTGGGGGGAGGAGNPLITGGPGYTWPINGVTYATGGNFPGTPAPLYYDGGATGSGGGGGASNAVGPLSPSGRGAPGSVVITYPSVPGAQIGTGGTVSTIGAGPALRYLHTYTAPGTYIPATKPTWVTTANITANLNVPFSTQLSATDISTVTYSIAAGNTLPAGISLTSSGVLSGTITAPTLGFYINAVNAVGGTTARVIDVSDFYPVAYLVVGGGGSPAGTPGGPGRYGGGGGGAFIPGTAAFQLGASYPISVGLSAGSPSVLSGPAPFSPITAPGGGPGATVGVNGTPSPGGSGGGGNTSGTGPPNWNYTLGGSGGTYGQPGGPGGFSISGSTPLAPTQNIAGGGGGGAGGAGISGNGPTGAGGRGGPGAIWPYTGPAVFYAGGSGGSSQQSPGTPNPGADGAGASYYGGGLGIQGVIILAVPTPVYPGSAPGATVSSPGFVAGYTLLTYTNTGTYTA